ncbi:MAG: terminase large subunit [Flavobacteriaceae bacterium]|nr:terminase large subunit [Flavobacteriaceae bacterium]
MSSIALDRHKKPLDVPYYQRRTNGAVFGRNCELLTELDQPDKYYYDQEAALWACEFYETVGVITEDGHMFKMGDPLELLDWQLQTTCNLFGVKRKEDNLRRYWTVVHLMPKKTGKSPYSSFTGLFLLCADNQGKGEIFTIACDKAQAGIIHKNSKKIAEKSEMLGSALIIRGEYIEHVRSGSKFWVTSAVESSKHGPNLSGIFFDEPHAYKDWSLVETLEQGIAARPEPVIMFSSTAGVKGSPFHKKMYKNAKALLNKLSSNDTELVFLYEPDVPAMIEKYGEVWVDGKKPWWAQEEVWAEVNPSYGLTVTKRYFENEVKKVRNGTRSLNKFLQMHLNVFTGNTDGWQIAEVWNQLKTIKEAA